MSDEDREHRVECFRKLAADMNLGHAGGVFGVAYLVMFSGHPSGELLGVLLGFYAVLCFVSSVKHMWDDRKDRKENLLIEDLENE